MNKKSVNMIVSSFIVLIVMCLGIIMLFAATMAKKSENAISNIGAIYMEGMNDEISNHFQTNIKLKFNQLETLIYNNRADEMQYGETMKTALEEDGRVRNFEILALLGAEGDLDIIYGKEVEIENADVFLDSLKQKNQRITFATSKSGKGGVLLGMPAAYPMKDGKTSVALVAGISMEYFNNVLALKDDGAITFSNIIKDNGDYVIKNYDDDFSNFFDRIKSYYKFDGKTGEEYVNEIKAAMKKKEDYTTVFFLHDERRHLYLSQLPDSEWFLLTILPYGNIEKIVSDLSETRMYMLIISVLIISVLFILIMIMFYRWNYHQMAALEKASRAKSDFLSNMSHDIRTPMNAIIGMTNIAIENIDDKAQVDNCLKKISKSNKYLLGLINDILDMAKIENGKMVLNIDTINLMETMDDIVTIMKPQMDAKNQEFEMIVSDISAEYVHCDSVRLFQIALNLLSNAVKFTPENGKILVKLYEKASEKSEDYVQVHFVVKDNGIGMSEKFKNKVFESFTREDSKRVNKTEGTGLGMAITKCIVDAMEGTIDVESEQGKGTEFHVTIDMKKDAAKEICASGKPTEDRDFSGVRVLVAEDNDLNWEVAEALLSQRGFLLDRVENGKQCVDLFNSSPEGYYSVILMDLRMPVMTGYEAAEAIRALDRADADVIIIAMTADAFSEDINKSIESGMNAHVAKPIDVQEIISTIETCIE